MLAGQTNSAFSEEDEVGADCEQHLLAGRQT